MHPNPAFQPATRAANIGFARARSFGTLAINAQAGPLLSHVPFVLNQTGTHLDLHLVRSNTILRALDLAQPAVLSVSGPDAYISPDWYDVPDQVPTWNYVAVHLRGTLERLPQDDLPALLDQISAQFEVRLAPKPPWTAGKMTPGVLTRMLRQIVPCRMTIETVDGTWKLGQNKPEQVRIDAARALAAAGDDKGAGAEMAQLAALMRNPPHG